MQRYAVEHDELCLRVAGRRLANTPELAEQQAFDEILTLIQNAKQRAYLAVNGELVNLYWQGCEDISGKLKSAAWGDATIAVHPSFTYLGEM